ncbi:hypothetical protein Bhyg_05749 [Pseudolycoriella hygida]|uniref:Ricin B lectin domain-containing protein n=1 Tax=Pseudolycoriella hygida TaxID=35572 RepID=A0A9Q0N085_9DIPT|nr:hypothetical protein Bhyg_05749 [Pseudolycoriella hygida]
MKLVLLISAVVSVTKGGELFWGDATEITDIGLFSLQCQQDGKFLTAGQSGMLMRQEWFDSPNQKFFFKSSQKNNEVFWKLSPIDGSKDIADYYKITDVGHGKYHLKSLSSGKCLQAQGRNAVGESECITDEPTQRWFAALAT